MTRPDYLGPGRVAVCLVVIAACAAIFPAAADAQSRWSVDATAGVAMPIGDLSDYHDLGASLEAGVGYRFHPRVRLRGLFGYHPLPGSDWNNVEPVDRGDPPSGPGGVYSYYLVGAAVPVTDPTAGGWRLFAVAGLGAAYMDMEPTQDSPGGRFTRPAAGGAVELEYPFSDHLSLLGRSTGFLFFRKFDGGGTGGRFGKELTFTYTAGARIHF